MGWIGSAVYQVAPKKPPGFWFSIAIGADYSFELNSIDTYGPQFFWHGNLNLGSVNSMYEYPYLVKYESQSYI